jgi:hypothetical protein
MFRNGTCVASISAKSVGAIIQRVCYNRQTTLRSSHANVISTTYHSPPKSVNFELKHNLLMSAQTRSITRTSSHSPAGPQATMTTFLNPAYASCSNKAQTSYRSPIRISLSAKLCTTLSKSCTMASSACVTLHASLALMCAYRNTNKPARPIPPLISRNRLQLSTSAGGLFG